LNVDKHIAQTGTVYLSVSSAQGKSLKIRVADHADLYANADYTCDGLEGTPAGARQRIMELRGTTWSAVRRLRRARRSRAARQNAAYRENWIEGVMRQWPHLYPTREVAEEEATRLFKPLR
jgi:hypothetical protein